MIGANIWYFGEGMMGPLFSVFSEKVGGDILDITWAWSAYLVITGLLYIVVGKLLNKKTFKAEVVVVGYVMNAALTFCYILVHNPLQLFLVQAGLGIAEALCTPAWDSLYATSHHEDLDTYAWGLSTGQSQLVTGIAFAIGGFITHYISFNALFITMGCIQVLAAIVTSRIIIERKS